MKSSVIVTGASSGIGAEIAREFSKNGHFVFLFGRDQKKLQLVQKTCLNETEIFAFDLKDLKDFKTTILNLLENRPPLEILVNNAGIYKQSRFEMTSTEIWNEQFQVNLLAPVELTQLIWPLFIKNKKGSVVNISSTLGIKPAPGTSAYSAIKAALNNLTITLAQEGGAHNIRVNAVCPGIVDTPIHTFHNLKHDEKSKITTELATLQMLPRIGQPSDIAQATYFLGSDQSAWTTGAILSVDGGIGQK